MMSILSPSWRHHGCKTRTEDSLRKILKDSDAYLIARSKVGFCIADEVDMMLLPSVQKYVWQGEP